MDNLLARTEFLNRIKASGVCAGRPLTQLGLDWINQELSTIEAQLDKMQPQGEFVTMLGSDNEPVGFEVKL